MIAPDEVNEVRVSRARSLLGAIAVVAWLGGACPTTGFGQQPFYYLGGDRVWSGTASWRMNYAGTVPATTAPGSADTAFFNVSSASSFQTTSLTADAAINGIVYGPANIAAMTFQGSGGNRTLTIGTGGIRAWNQTNGFPQGTVTFGNATDGSNVNVSLAGSQDWRMLGRAVSVANQLNGSAGAGASQTLFITGTYAGNGNTNDTAMQLQGAVIGNGTAGGKLNLWFNSPSLIRLSASNTLTGALTVQNTSVGLESKTYSWINTLQLASANVSTNGNVTLSGSGSVRMLGGMNTMPFGRSLLQTGTLERQVGGGVFFNNSTVTGVAGATLVNGVIPWAWTGGDAPVPTQVVSGSLVAATLSSPSGGDINNITGSTGNWQILFAGTSSLTQNVSPSLLRTDALLTNLNGFTLEANALYLYRRATLTISASAGGNLKIGSSGELLITNASDSIATLLAINAPITGTGWATIAPSGTLTLSGSNSHTAGTSFVRGTLGLGHAYALGSGTFRINGGAVLDNVTGGPLTIATNNRQEWNSDFTFPGTQPLDLGTGTVSLGSWAGTWRTLTVNGTAALTVGGRIEDGSYADLPTRGLIKSGSGTLVLAGTNAYTGGTELTAGFLGITTDANLGAVSASLLFNGGALRILGTTPTTLAAGRSVSAMIDQPIWFDVADPGQTFTVSHSLGQTGTGGGLVKTGSGVLVLTGTSTFTLPPNVNGGVLSVDRFASPGQASALGSGTTVNLGSGIAAGTLRYTGAGESTSRVLNLAGASGGGGIEASGIGALVVTSTVTAANGSKTLTLLGTSTAANVIGVIANPTNGSLAVVKDGPGMWRLTGTSTFTLPP
ncbi:MAG: beta strand repeat-containing protein, partial [Planctomycetota bacterium]